MRDPLAGAVLCLEHLDWVSRLIAERLHGLCDRLALRQILVWKLQGWPYKASLHQIVHGALDVPCFLKTHVGLNCAHMVLEAK